MTKHTWEFPALGTGWSISSELPLGSATVALVRARVESFDQTYSRFRSDSLVAQLHRQPGTHCFPDDSIALFALYRQLYDCTNGAVTPLTGSALDYLGYGIGYRLSPAGEPTPVPSWDDVMSIDGSTVTTSEPVLLDFGAAGKGHLVDLLARLLTERGITDYVIDASGDLIHHGSTPEQVGLENPQDPRQVIGVAHVSNRALCASATTRRCWGENLHHIIDPATGLPTVGVIATWVSHSSCATADGLATALFLTEPEQLSRAFDYSFVKMNQDGSLNYSSNFDGELFTDTTTQ